MQPPPSDTGGMPGTASAVTSELGADAKRVGHSAANRVHSELDSRKTMAADQAKSVSSAIEQAAGGLGDNAPQWLKSAFQQSAEQVRRFADTLEQKDSRQIVDEVRTIARDNPGTFLAGCAAIGFAAARVFKAGEPAPAPKLLMAPEYKSSQGDEPVFRSWGSDPTGAAAPSGGMS